MKRLTPKLFGEVSEIVAQLCTEGHSIAQIKTSCRQYFRPEDIDSADIEYLTECAAETWQAMQVYEPGDPRHTPRPSD